MKKRCVRIFFAYTSAVVLEGPVISGHSPQAKAGGFFESIM